MTERVTTEIEIGGEHANRTIFASTPITIQGKDGTIYRSRPFGDGHIIENVPPDVLEDRRE